MNGSRRMRHFASILYQDPQSNISRINLVYRKLAFNGPVMILNRQIIFNNLPEVSRELPNFP